MRWNAGGAADQRAGLADGEVVCLPFTLYRLHKADR